MDRGAKKVFEEIMKNRGFRWKGEDDISVLIIKVLDLVFLKADGSTKVEIAGVLF
jgi:hypothetical protein